MLTCTEAISVHLFLLVLRCSELNTAIQMSLRGAEGRGRRTCLDQLAVLFLLQLRTWSGIDRGLPLSGTMHTKFNCINVFSHGNVWADTKRTLAQNPQTQHSVKRNIKMSVLQRTMHEFGKLLKNLKINFEMLSNLTCFWNYSLRNCSVDS